MDSGEVILTIAVIGAIWYFATSLKDKLQLGATATALTTNQNANVQQNRQQMVDNTTVVPDYVVIPGVRIEGVTDYGSTTAGELRTAGWTDAQIQDALHHYVGTTAPPNSAVSAWEALFGITPNSGAGSVEQQQTVQPPPQDSIPVDPNYDPLSLGG